MKGRSTSIFMFAFPHMYIVDNDGWTLLHHACFYEHLEIAEYLLDHNTDPSIRGGSFPLVFCQLLTWKMQIMTVELLFGLPKGGGDRMWFRCLPGGGSENEIVCDCRSAHILTA
jgi:ankyrin repeat protein